MHTGLLRGFGGLQMMGQGGYVGRTKCNPAGGIFHASMKKRTVRCAVRSMGATTS